MKAGTTDWTGQKPIPEQRDRLQSRVLTAVVACLLVWCSLRIMLVAICTPDPVNDSALVRLALLPSSVFALVVWRLRAATPPAALLGALICLEVTVLSATPGHSLLRSGLTPLIVLFLCTFAATRIARLRGVPADRVEVKHGRRASQVIANLGLAGLLGWLSAFRVPASGRLEGAWFPAILLSHALLTAVLAESTADTVASEIGQAFGGTPRMIWSWRAVEPGTDGAVTAVGTLAGVLAAALVTWAGALALALPWPSAACALAGGIGGLFFDSVLGATVERRGWLGNDLVNFCSNAFAALVTVALLLV